MRDLNVNVTINLVAEGSFTEATRNIAASDPFGSRLSRKDPYGNLDPELLKLKKDLMDAVHKRAAKRREAAAELDPIKQQKLMEEWEDIVFLISEIRDQIDFLL